VFITFKPTLTGQYTKLSAAGAPSTETYTATNTISERRNTLVCCFDPTSPRLTSFEIHEWIHLQLKVLEHTVSMIQIDGVRRQVYIKFSDISYVHDILSVTNGETIYRHATGEISPVRLLVAGMRQKRVRLAKLPPEIS